MCIIALGIVAPKEVSFALGLILCLSPQQLSSSLQYSPAAQIVKPVGAFRLTTNFVMNLSSVWRWSGSSVLSQCANRQPLLHSASRRWVICFLSICGFVCVFMLNRRRTLEINAGRKKKGSEGVDV